MWLDIDGQRWRNTGDLGREDQDGYFRLGGRKRELIIRGGHNLDPKQSEDVLQGPQDVALAAAIGCPDAHAGEVPAAYVQLNSGSRRTTEQLTAFAARHIAERASVPKRIVVVDALPVTPLGKIFKPALQ